jgi:hypothetical protein
MTCSISGGCIANYGFLEQIKYNTIQYNIQFETHIFQIYSSQFCDTKGCQPAEIPQQMQAMYSNTCASKMTVKDWFKQLHKNVCSHVAHSIKTKVQD